MNDDAIPDLLADKMDFSGKSVVLDEGRSQEVLYGPSRPKADGRLSCFPSLLGEQTGLGPKRVSLVSGSNHVCSICAMPISPQTSCGRLQRKPSSFTCDSNFWALNGILGAFGIHRFPLKGTRVVYTLEDLKTLMSLTSPFPH